MPSKPDALKTWREDVGRRLVGLNFAPASDVPFKARFDVTFAHGGVKIGRWWHTPGATLRDRELLKDGVDSLAMVYSERGSIAADHCGKSFRLAAGEATVLHSGRPGALHSSGRHSYIAVMLPRCERLRRLEELLAVHWSRQSPALRLLQSYIGALDVIGQRPTEALGGTAVNHLLDLTELAAHEQLNRDTRELQSRIGDHRIVVARDTIQRNFRDSGLSEQSVAAQQNISVRQLQRLLERAGVRFTGLVNQLRLEAAYRDLTDPEQSGRTVLDIALAAGFSDISHFNRTFRRKFDATPGAVRSSKPFSRGLS